MALLVFLQLNPGYSMSIKSLSWFRRSQPRGWSRTSPASPVSPRNLTSKFIFNFLIWHGFIITILNEFSLRIFLVWGKKGSLISSRHLFPLWEWTFTIHALLQFLRIKRLTFTIFWAKFMKTFFRGEAPLWICYSATSITLTNLFTHLTFLFIIIIIEGHPMK